LPSTAMNNPPLFTPLPKGVVLLPGSSGGF
jgi:hypothetical protein